MIATIEGIVSEKLGEAVIISINGLGYDVILTASDWGASPVGEVAKFYIYEQIREDAHNLFGFSSPQAKQLFVKLLGVSGVGPKVAMQVMGAASLDRLQQAISAGDVDLFKGVSGVGKKTAERIMVELKGKVEFVGSLGLGDMATTSSHDPAYQALVALGYTPAQASEAVQRIPAETIGEQDRVKAALKQVS